MFKNIPTILGLDYRDGVHCNLLYKESVFQKSDQSDYIT